MKLKSFIISVIALLAFGSNAMADTNKLTTAAGWTKITTLPSATDIANNYYVFVDNSNDLMLGVAKGVEQKTKWYSLGLYYQTSVEPTSADMNGKTWILESYDGGYAMRNVEYPVLVFQTEWNANYRWDTNDVQTPNEWAKINLAYLPNGYWTIENAHDAGNYIGPWTAGNFTNGAECAGNKTGENVGKFQIYTISRAQFKQNLLDNASASNPVDLTPWYVNNATFDAGNRTGWTEEGSGGNNNTSFGGGCEIWHRSNFKIYQDVTVPNGKYKVSLQIAGGSVGDGQVYGTSGSTNKTVASSATAGSNFQNTILSMIQDRTFGKVTTEEIEVSNGSLQMGMQCSTSDQWIVFDNFKLYCTGVDLSAYQAQLASLVQDCNDFIASNVVPNACETAISNAVSQYNQNYSTAAEYSAAIVALTNVLDTYRNDTDLQTAYANFNSFKTKIQTLSTGQESSTALTTFNNAVSTATSNCEAATTVAGINAQITALRSAGLTYISDSSVSGSFDITFLASQNYADWKKKDGSAAGVVADQYLANRPSSIPSFAENFEWTAATTGNVLYQTVSDLPAGYYQVGMYTMALSTSQRDNIATDATEGDADRTFAFVGDLNDATTILRTGMPIKFATAVDFNDLSSTDVNVHLTGNTNNLTFGVQKDANGSNWHFAQIASIVYSNSPDLTALKETRDQLVAEAQGLLASSGDYLTSAQKTALQDAITAGNNANTFDALNTVTLTTLPNAINTAKQQIAQAKAAIPVLHAALERFERDYNLVDGTDYRRVTMSAKAWTDLLAAVDNVTTALDDISQAGQYATLAAALNAQMDATDVSIRLFKSYKAMVEGCQSLSIAAGTTYAADSYMDTDAKEEEAIAALNTAFVSYRESQTTDFSAAGFLGANLDFETNNGSQIDGSFPNVYEQTGWETTFSSTADAANLGYAYLTNTTDGVRTGGTSYLRIRAKWQSSNPTMRILKERMLPAGDYQLKFYVKNNNESSYNTDYNYYKLGNNQVPTTPASSGWTEVSYDFNVSEPTMFDMSFGFITGTGTTAAEVSVDDITLICQAATPFQQAYNEANAADDNTAETAAAKAATTEYAQYDGNESGLLDNGERGDAYWEAVYVLRNAKTIAEASGSVNSLIKNRTFSTTSGGTAATGSTKGDSGNFTIPKDWTLNYDLTGWNSTTVTNGVYNVWAGGINKAELMQTLTNLPKGIYQLTAEVGTSVTDGSSTVAIYINPNSNDYVGRSQEVITLNEENNRNFGTYSCAAEVVAASNHQLSLGIYTEKSYYQVQNFNLTYLGNTAPAQQEASSSYLRQNYFWNGKDAFEYDATGEKYASAQEVVLYPNQKNQLIKASSLDQFANKKNKIVNGTCANLEITDGAGQSTGYGFQTSEAFTATNATFKRAFSTNVTRTTICLPFAPDASKGKYYQLSTVDEANGRMIFDEVTTPVAYQPYVFVPEENIDEMTATGASVTVTPNTALQTDPVNGYYMVGTLNNQAVTNAYGYTKSGALAFASSGSINAFRVFIQAPNSTAKNFIGDYVDGTADGVYQMIFEDDAVVDVYTASGVLVRKGVKRSQALQGLSRGMYIVGGIKTVK